MAETAARRPEIAARAAAAVLSGIWSTGAGVLVALAFPAGTRWAVCLTVASAVAPGIGCWLGRHTPLSRSITRRQVKGANQR